MNDSSPSVPEHAKHRVLHSQLYLILHEIFSQSSTPNHPLICSYTSPLQQTHPSLKTLSTTIAARNYALESRHH